MVHYSRKPQVTAKSAKAKISDLRCHFKNTFETANVINGMPLRKAQQLYRQVLAKTRCIPFRRYNGKIGRTGQAKEWGQTKGRWPRKSVAAMMTQLRRALTPRRWSSSTFRSTRPPACAAARSVPTVALARTCAAHATSSST